jgi:hypothetical protein
MTLLPITTDVTVASILATSSEQGKRSRTFTSQPQIQALKNAYLIGHPGMKSSQGPTIPLSCGPLHWLLFQHTSAPAYAGAPYTHTYTALRLCSRYGVMCTGTKANAMVHKIGGW